MMDLSGRALFLVLSVMSLAAQTPNSNTPARSQGSISLADRAFIVTKIYHQIATFYPEFSQQQFDRAYIDYLSHVLDASVDRRSFDFASMALVATLHDGHSWFYDDWLDKSEGQRIGVTVYSRDGQWVVVNSELNSVRVGDVIEAINGQPIQQFLKKTTTHYPPPRVSETRHHSSSTSRV